MRYNFRLSLFFNCSGRASSIFYRGEDLCVVNIRKVVFNSDSSEVLTWLILFLPHLPHSTVWPIQSACFYFKFVRLFPSTNNLIFFFISIQFVRLFSNFPSSIDYSLNEVFLSIQEQQRDFEIQSFHSAKIKFNLLLISVFA